MVSEVSTQLIVAIVFAEDIVAALILGYAAFWAFSIRRAVNNKYLRSQCLWLGVVGVGLIPLLPTPVYTSDALESLLINTLFAGVLPLLVLAWIDSTVRIDRRSDPLLRDTFGWSRLRIGVWVATIGLVALPYLFFQAMVEGTFPAEFQALVLAGPYLPTLFVGAPVLLLSARRSKSLVRRKNVEWLGLFALFLLLSIFAATIASSSVTAIPSGFFYFLAFQGIYLLTYMIFELLFIASAYCLYRCARSLAPLNRAAGAPKSALEAL